MNRIAVTVAASVGMGTALLLAAGTAAADEAPHSGGAASAAGVSATGIWGTAQLVTGLGGLNSVSKEAQVVSMSCVSPGNCAAGGLFDATRSQQGFLDTEQSGTWGKAAEVPGIRTLAPGGSNLHGVSCSTEVCAAAGTYRVTVNATQGEVWVDSESRGTWAKAEEVPGLAALDTGGGYPEVNAVSCAGGECVAGGDYQFNGSHGAGQGAFLVTLSGETWGNAQRVPGIAVDFSQSASITSVSCMAPGTCTAGGYRWERNNEQGFVVSETDGTWGRAQAVPGMAALDAGGGGQVTTLSCASAGNCVAGGWYRHGGLRGFVVTETGGAWGSAEEVPGLAALNTGKDARVSSVSCSTAGACAGGGYYTLRGGHVMPFVVSWVGGSWGTAIDVPGLPGTNSDPNAGVASVSCAGGTCGVGGEYRDHAFVVTQTNGTWGQASNLPGLKKITVSGGGSGIETVSCATAANCSAAGSNNAPVAGSSTNWAFVTK
ncbi:MAG TPA: hypothetical protein VGS19_14120 [Streptosporangiaceae bacterium]|nr:hypothetical protein [Streptosporangiaceae bacterium]